MSSLASSLSEAKSLQGSLSYRPYINVDGGGCVVARWLLRSKAKGGGAAAALKLDTRILEGKSFKNYRPEVVPHREKDVYRDRPINYPIYRESVHYRAKIQEFSAGGYEVTLMPINMQRIADRQMLARPRGARSERKGDEESIEKARRRAKRMVRLKCMEMAADHLMTFTTRKVITRDELKAAWGRFCDNVSYHMGRKFSYVCVCERHPTNPDHLHLHAAIRGRLSPRELVIFRRCWYIALGGNGTEKGAAVPGGLNIREIRVKGGINRRMERIASYISKYVTKDDLGLFNKKRYWASKINLIEARTYWLKARTLGDALGEFLKEFNFFPSDLKRDFFQARNQDLIWMRCCPGEGGGLGTGAVPF